MTASMTLSSFLNVCKMMRMPQITDDYDDHFLGEEAETQSFSDLAKDTQLEWSGGTSGPTLCGRRHSLAQWTASARVHTARTEASGAPGEAWLLAMPYW